MTAALFRQARPKQWVKNLLVFAAPGAAGVLDDPSSLWATIVIFVAFCLVSSGTYFWNDLLDGARPPLPRAAAAVASGIGRTVTARGPMREWFTATLGPGSDEAKSASLQREPVTNAPTADRRRR